MANNKSNRRKTRKEPSPEAVKWHSGLLSARETIGSANGLITTMAQYAPIIGRGDFRSEITEEERTKLTESINVIRVAAEELVAVTGPAGITVSEEANRAYEDRDSGRFTNVEATVVDATIAFNESALASGHLDNVHETIQVVIERLDGKATKEVVAEVEEGEK